MKRAQLTMFVIGLLIMPLLGQTAQKLADINKKVVGKWMTSDGESDIEFRPNGSCSNGGLYPDGKWHVDQNTLGAWQQGEEFRCGDGSLTLIGPNTLSRDFGMGGEPVKYYRGSENLPKPVGALTVTVAQTVLNQQINLPTVNNTLFTCHACYDPSDKGDNDRAPLVNTYSASLSKFLSEHGYIRIVGGQQVFTAKTKRSRYYEVVHGIAGLRLASFRNPHILPSKIADPAHVPIEYDLVPTEVTTGFFGKIQRVKSAASFSYENEAWRLCIACRQ